MADRNPRGKLAIPVAVVASFLLGTVLSGTIGATGAAEGVVSPEPDLPHAALASWLPPVERYDNGGEPLSDEDFDELMAALEVAMKAKETLRDFEREAEFHIRNLARRLMIPEVGEEQRERLGAYLDALAEEHPDHRDMIEREANMLEFYAASMPTMSGFAGQALSAPGVLEYPDPGQPFTAAHVDRALAAIDAVLALPEVASDFERGTEVSLSGLSWGLQRSPIDDEQAARMVAGLEALMESHPAAAESLDRVRFLVEHLLPGRVAPNIVGTDTEGVAFELDDYRGKIIAVIFSGQWCGPCRGEYPYQRAMLELFADEDVALLGVNSDAELGTIVEAKKEEGLAYPTWWDGHSQPDAEVVAANGPIATEWGVLGWPTIYVIDESGVIRHIDKRGGALIEAVDDLLMEKRMREFREREEAETEGEAEAGGEVGAGGEAATDGGAEIGGEAETGAK